MTMDFTDIVIVAGNYGSGKTETAVNLAAACRKTGKSVAIADLDLVNPYFRTREAIIPLEAMGVKVVLPDRQYLHADLPILAPAVADILRNPADVTILDAGGDDVGVTVLASLAAVLKDRKIRMLQVINAFRPFTGDVAGCLKIQKQIEASGKIKITGLVSNANLMDETSAAHVYQGYDLVQQVSAQTGLPVEFITATPQIQSQLDPDRIACPILTIDRHLTPPWKHPNIHLKLNT
ncbi:MAG: cobalamin biosynthesis protein CbiA [Desulfotignum sp.]|nr:cobalamin biosynthesis protein CbiA [Desulfotignum sp.]